MELVHYIMFQVFRCSDLYSYYIDDHVVGTTDLLIKLELIPNKVNSKKRSEIS